MEGGNRVAAIAQDGGAVTIVRYDDAGRAVRLETRDDVVEVAYAPRGTPRRVSSVSSGRTWETEGGSASRRAAQADADLRTVLLHDPPAPTQPEHAVVDFDERTFAPTLRDPMRAGVPGLAEASRLVGVAARGSGGGAVPAFEAFHPPEYRGANGAAGTVTASRLPPLPGNQRVCTDTFCGNCVDIPVSEDPCQPRYKSRVLFGAEGGLYCVRCPTPPRPPPPPPPPLLPPICLLEINIEPGTPAISATPAMPTITATVTNAPSDATVSWSAQIAHTAPGGTCSGGPQFNSPIATGSGTSFTPTFGGIYGGTLTVSARCSAPGYQSSTAGATVTVNGTQPPTSSVVATIGTVGSPFEAADLRRIACHESPGLRQFQGSPGPPMFGPGGDVGIMQICYKRTAAHVWDWKENISYGKRVLDDSRKSAKNHLNAEVARGATPYTTRYWREEAIHRYNAGTGDGNEYRIWAPASDGRPARWETVDRGGVGGYVPAVLGIGAGCL